MKNPYEVFNNYVLRTPLLPLSKYKEFTSREDISDEDFMSLCNNPAFREALFLASPSFYYEMDKWSKGNLKDEKKCEKVKLSILKYFSRMSSRCTPFGLFAGCSVGKFAQETKIELNSIEKKKRHTRLDMNYLVELSLDLNKNKKIREQLLFYPNTSMYKVGRKLRYTEYKYVNGKRQDDIVAVDSSIYLDKILHKASEGALLNDLAKELVDNEITFEEAMEFVEELVQNQLLISELEPSVSGPEFMEQIKTVLSKINDQGVLNILEKVDSQIKKIDAIIGNKEEEYIKVKNLLENLGTNTDIKFMYQTDLVLNPKNNTLNITLTNDLKKALALLNKITLPYPATLLTEFKNSFRDRFETREVPLSKALDIEMGIGYKQGHSNSGGENPLIDDIVIPGNSIENEIKGIKWSSIDALFQKKLVNAFKNRDYTITLTDEDFKDLDIKWDDLPDTMSSIIEIIDTVGQEKIKINGIGGPSANNLLGRFCHGDKDLYKYVTKIVDIESKINENKILAEIVHLPKSRVGNVLMRPDFRSYEIPYLARSIKPNSNQIQISDLTISVDSGGKILLNSNYHNKEVIPRMSNAHNYASNSLPIYHFLCDMQTQGLRQGVGFSLGPFANDYEFLPRIEYENIILNDATWNLKNSHISQLIKYQDDNSKLKKAIEDFRASLVIPQFVMLTDNDNELLLNFGNLTSVRMFLGLVSKRPQFKLTEFLFADNGIVKYGNEYYTNQVIVSFYNKKTK